MSWEILQAKLADLAAGRIMLTHMNPTVLSRLDEVRAAGVLVADDGLHDGVLRRRLGTHVPRDAGPTYPTARSGWTCPSACRPSSAPAE